MTVKQTVPPTLPQITDAQEILFNPGRSSCTPSLYLASWLTLKTARGQTVNMDHIGAPAHRILPSDTLLTRIRAKVRAYAIVQGYSLADTPAPRPSATQQIGAC